MPSGGCSALQSLRVSEANTHYVGKDGVEYAFENYLHGKDGKVIESMPMPIAGLMSDQSGEWVDEKLKEIHEKAHTVLGVNADVAELRSRSDS